MITVFIVSLGYFAVMLSDAELSSAIPFSAGSYGGWYSSQS